MLKFYKSQATDIFEKSKSLDSPKMSIKRKRISLKSINPNFSLPLASCAPSISRKFEVNPGSHRHSLGNSSISNRTSGSRIKKMTDKCLKQPDGSGRTQSKTSNLQVVPKNYELIKIPSTENFESNFDNLENSFWDDADLGSVKSINSLEEDTLATDYTRKAGPTKTGRSSGRESFIKQPASKSKSIESNFKRKQRKTFTCQGKSSLTCKLSLTKSNSSTPWLKTYTLKKENGQDGQLKVDFQDHALRISGESETNKFEKLVNLPKFIKYDRHKYKISTKLHENSNLMEIIYPRQESCQSQDVLDGGLEGGKVENLRTQELVRPLSRISQSPRTSKKWLIQQTLPNLDAYTSSRSQRFTGNSEESHFTSLTKVSPNSRERLIQPAELTRSFKVNPRTAPAITESFSLPISHTTGEFCTETDILDRDQSEHDITTESRLYSKLGTNYSTSIGSDSTIHESESQSKSLDSEEDTRPSTTQASSKLDSSSIYHQNKPEPITSSIQPIPFIRMKSKSNQTISESLDFEFTKTMETYLSADCLSNSHHHQMLGDKKYSSQLLTTRLNQENKRQKWNYQLTSDLKSDGVVLDFYI